VKRFSDRHQLTTLSELNVTPLLDLAFVLLIIFMITTPLMENSTELVLPTSKGAEGAAPSDVETITVDRDGVVKLNDEALAPEALKASLESLRSARPRVGVVVRAHKELAYQKVIEVMDIIKSAGITKVGVGSVSPATSEAR